jgi:hypothetical protein
MQGAIALVYDIQCNKLRQKRAKRSSKYVDQQPDLTKPRQKCRGLVFFMIRLNCCVG